ncbi:MAG: hypothetical protein JXB25_06065 [Deltaproteobacteria bacterium]|nr:hypothetical protein [Deltaproteobacteria bacterium]
MNIPLRKFLGRRTLIVGGIKSGKTRWARAFVEQVLAQRPESVAVLDLAPDLYRGVGGKMALAEHSRLRYLTTRIEAPRLRGQDEAEALALAEGNRARIEPLLEDYLAAPAEILVINDATLYLHAGSAERLLLTASKAGTLVVNGYYGRDFPEGAVSLRERRALEQLMPFFDRVLLMEEGRLVVERHARPGK